MEKLCIFCKHMAHNSGGYGEYAEEDTFICDKKRWPIEGDGYWKRTDVDCDDLPGFRKRILFAAQCPDYTPHK